MGVERALYYKNLFLLYIFRIGIDTALDIL